MNTRICICSMNKKIDTTLCFMVLCTVLAMSSFQTFLSVRNQEYLRCNDQEIIEAAIARNSDLVERVEHFRADKLTADERDAMSVDDVLMAIQRNALVRAWFRKDPGRQSIHEKTQVEWIRRHRHPDIVKLKSAKGGYILSEGNLLVAETGRPPNATKTFDTFDTSRNAYGVLKYSTTEGGAQDNQYKDVKDFVRQILAFYGAHPGATEIFEFYLDGPYYTDRKRSELAAMIPAEYVEKIRLTQAADIYAPT